MNVQSSPTMFYSLIALAASALMTIVAIESQRTRDLIMANQSEAIQNQASRYATPPTDTKVRSAIRGFDLERVTFGTLDLILGDVEASLETCAATGRDIQKISKIERGAVHRGWYVYFQNCVEQRAREIQVLGHILEDRQEQLFKAGAYVNPAEARNIVDLSTQLGRVKSRLTATRAVEKSLGQ